jgi:hypothetical protein
MWVKSKNEERRRVTWTGVECGNPDSDYFKALLNIDVEGNRQIRVTWPGCRHGERRVLE